MSLETAIATVGVSLLLIAFAMNLGGLLMTNSRLYQGLNAVGAALACLASAMIGFVSFVVLEGVWLIVALFALAGRLRSHNLGDPLGTGS